MFSLWEILPPYAEKLGAISKRVNMATYGKYALISNS